MLLSNYHILHKAKLSKRKMASLDNYSNEGFLYINTKATETFKKGEIVDGYMHCICPGVIVPIVPILEKQRDVGESDKDLVSIETCLDQITHYYPVQKCKKLRIYWDQNHETFMVSTELRIYPCYEEEIDLSSVNLDLLDNECCYYVDMLYNGMLILTNIVDKTKPEMQGSYNIEHDLAFENHNELIKYDGLCQVDAKYGIVCILSNGLPIEIRTQSYNYYCSLVKPDNMCIAYYYVLCLNKDAEGDNIWDYFISLHDFVSEFVDAYPEYSDACELMSEKLLNYIEKYELFDNIENVINMDPDNLLELLC